jgi:hypothetical protein
MAAPRSTSPSRVASAVLGAVTMAASPRTTIPAHRGGHISESGEITTFTRSRQENAAGAAANSAQSSRARPSR